MVRTVRSSESQTIYWGIPGSTTRYCGSLLRRGIEEQRQTNNELIRQNCTELLRNAYGMMYAINMV